MQTMTEDTSRMKRREWVVIDSVDYLDGTIETREGRPLLPRLRMKMDFCARPANGRPMFFPTMTDAKRWIDEAQTGGNPSGFLHEIIGRKFRRHH